MLGRILAQGEEGFGCCFFKKLNGIATNTIYLRTFFAGRGQHTRGNLFRLTAVYNTAAAVIKSLSIFVFLKEKCMWKEMNFFYK